MRASSSAAVALLALMISGCGIGHSIEGVTWRAKLDSMPSVDCVKSAVAATTEVTLTKYQHEEKTHLFGRPADMIDHYYLKMTAVRLVADADMGLHIAQSGKVVSLSLNHIHARNFEAQYEAADKAVLTSVAGRCGVPELMQRVRRSIDSSWTPYFFNV